MLPTKSSTKLPYKEDVGSSSLSTPIALSGVSKFHKALLKGKYKGTYYSERTAYEYSRYVRKFLEQESAWEPKAVKRYILRISSNKKEVRVKAWKALKCYAGYFGLEFPQDLPMPEGNKSPSRQFMLDSDAEKLLSSCLTETETLAVLLLYETGMRRMEAIDLRWEHIDLEAPSIYIHLGKGGVSRYLGIPVRLKSFLEAHKKEKGRVLPFKATGLRNCLGRVSERAGLKHITPHVIRRAFVTSNLKRGKAITVVQAAAGHKSVVTTELYNRLQATEVTQEMSTW